MPTAADCRATYRGSLAFLPGREELPLLLNERRLLGCGVEVGVQEGLYSEHLLASWKGKHLISIDPWREDSAEAYVDIANVPQTEHDARYAATRARLARFGARSSIWRLTSLEGAARIPNHSLDFVYIDARHDFESVTEDLHAWFDKVRPGGIIAGHDYVDDDGPCGEFRVKSAVDAFFGRMGLPVHVTLMDKPWLSWMVEVPLPAQAPIAPGLANEIAEPRNGTPAASGASPARQGNGATAPEPRRLEPAAANGASASSSSRPERPATNGAAPVGREVKLNLHLATGDREFRLRLDDRHMSQRMMLECFDAQQLYESETSQLLVTVLRPGDTFVDVGSHVGYFSMLAASLVGPEGTVVAFEPDLDNFRQLQGHIELNGYRNVAPMNAAVGDHTGTIEFHVNADNDGGHALWKVGDHPFNQRSRQAPNIRRVDIVSLDAVLTDIDLPAPRVMKIDVEGAEHSVLKGAARILTESPVAYVIAEINRFGLQQMGTTEQALRGYMTGLGYETYAFDPAGGSILRIGDDDRIESDYVFNLVFRHPLAAAA